MLSCVSEIVKVRSNLFQINGSAKQPLELPEPQGAVVTLSEKVYVPIKEHPDVSTRLCGSADRLRPRQAPTWTVARRALRCPLQPILSQMFIDVGCINMAVKPPLGVV